MARSSSYWPENPSFIFSDTCHCGHERQDHAIDNNICVHNKNCHCRGFLP